MASWQIPLDVGKGVQPLADPLQAQAQALNMRHLAGAVAIQQQQQAENQLKIQAAREDQNDQDTIKQAFSNQSNWSPGSGGIMAPDYDKIRSAISPTVRLRNLQALDTEHLNLIKGMTAMKDEQRKAITNKNTAVGNELMGLLQTPQDQRQGAYLAARQRLIQSGDINPDEYPEDAPLDDQNLKAHLAHVGYAAQVSKLADQQAQEEQRKQLAAKAAAQTDKEAALASAKQTQQQLEDAARDHLAVTDQAGHDQWLADLKENSPDAYKRYANLKTFNPATQRTIENMALTSEQRAMRDKRDADAKAELMRVASSGGLAGLVARAHDPTLPDQDRQAARDAADELEKRNTRMTANASAVQGRFDQREADQRSKDAQKDSSDHTKLREQEITAATESARYQAAIAKAKGGNVVDPKTGRTISPEEAQSVVDGAKAKAASLWDQQNILRQRHQWGEYAPGKEGARQNPWQNQKPAAVPAPAGQTQAPAAQAPPPPTTSPASVQSGQTPQGGTPQSMGGFTVGQRVAGPDKKFYVVTGFKNGKVQTRPE